MKSSNEVLAERLAALLQATGKTWSNQAIAEAASSAGKQIGRSSIDRIRKAEGNPTLENIDALAAFLKINAWRLLCDEDHFLGVPTLEQAIDVLASNLDSLPPEARENAAYHLQTLARAPDSKKARDALQAAIHTSEASSTTTQLMGMNAKVESQSFQKTKNHE